MATTGGARRKVLERIAAEHWGIETPETRRRDPLDYGSGVFVRTERID